MEAESGKKRKADDVVVANEAKKKKGMVCGSCRKRSADNKKPEPWMEVSDGSSGQIQHSCAACWQIFKQGFAYLNWSGFCDLQKTQEPELDLI